MLEMYRTELETNVTEKTAKYEKGNWINMISPTEEEINDVCNNLKIKEDFIRYALDYEEKARIDIEEDDIRTEVYGGYSISNPDPDKQATINVKDRAVEVGIYEDFDLESHINIEIYKEALESILKESPDDAIYKSLKEHFDQYE